MYDSKKKTAYDLYLEHHGIKGQKWGVRRYQNTDGSLTSAGRQRYGYGDPNPNTKKAVIEKKLKEKQAEFDKIDKEIDDLEKRDMELANEQRDLRQWDQKNWKYTFKNEKDRKRYEEISNERMEIEDKLEDPFGENGETLWDKYHNLDFEITELKKGRDISAKAADQVQKAYREVDGYDMGEKDYKEFMETYYGEATKAGKELAKLKDQRDAAVASDPKIQKLSEAAHQPGAYGSKEWFEWRDAIWDKRKEYNEKFTDALIKNSEHLKDYSNNKDVRDFINEYAQWDNELGDYSSIWDPDSGERDYGLEDYLHNWKRK